MQKLCHNNKPVGKSPLLFFILTFAISTPFWVFGALTGKQLLPDLPVSSLMILGPLLAALLLAYREQQIDGATALLKRACDFRRISNKRWYIPILLLMPGVMTLEYGILRGLGRAIPAPHFSALTVLSLFLVFFLSALLEELGWMGYAIDPMQARFGAYLAALILGLVWAVWHFIPLLQVGRTPIWIGWWSLATVAQRVIIVWLYNNTRQSIFGVAVYHAMMNITWQLFPINGSFYDARITALIVTCIAVAIIATGSRMPSSRLAEATEPTTSPERRRL